MSRMPDSLPFWIAGALAVFWFVGAYNRLVRARSAALQAYAALDAALVRQVDFVQGRVAAEPGGNGVFEHGPHGASLPAAASQLLTLLAATRLRPLEPAGIAALGTALHVLLSAWQRLHPDAVASFDADGVLSRPAPLSAADEAPGSATAPVAWPEPSAAAELARNQFNQAVARYNAAITQFPALLVAWIMQLRRAAPLQ
jgi:LemA protein